MAFMPRRNTHAAVRSTGHSDQIPADYDRLLNWWLRKAAFACLHHESLIERIPVACYAGCRGCFVVPHVIADEGAGHAELHVRLEFLIVIDIDLRDKSFEAFLENQKMQMSRAIIVTSRGAHQIADRTVDRDGIACRFDTAEGEMTFSIGHEFATQIHWRLLGILLLIKSFRRGVPYIDFRAGDRLPVLVLHLAIDEQRWAGSRRAHDRTAVFGSG